MSIETAERAKELVEQINKMSKYKDILENREYGKVAHFELSQRYRGKPDRLVFEHIYTLRFIEVVEQIIKELNNELAAL
jgi:hypothetical protein